jgi:diguanylate cyclase (GGDEF)-like protein
VVILINPHKTDLEEITNHTKTHPFGTAIYKAREVNELKQDIKRLREEIERAEESLEKYKSHEPRLTETEYEKQFYQLSNKLRGCMNVQELFPLAAREIGQTNRVSRCLLIQLLSSGDRVEVFEYHHPHTEPAANLFNTDEGIAFTKAAMASQAPQQLFDPDTEFGGIYNSDFLRKLGLKSGLILPIVTRNTTIGIIFLNQCTVSQEWGIGDTARLGTLADLVAVSIENALLHAKIEKLSVTDGLTGIANRRKFDEKFQEEFERAKRYQEPLSLLVFDLDYLKKINDTYGHPAGDEAIKAIGLVLDQSSRSIDLAARFGGEEFCLLLPNTDLELASQIAERIREKINKIQVEGPGNISVSVGVAAFTGNETDPQQLFQKADQAMYKAKQSGRNQVCQA